LEEAVEEGRDQPGGDAYVYSLTDEQAYLEIDEDEKPEIMEERLADPAKFRCWFCRKSHQQVQMLFGAEYPVRDPNDFSNETPIFICNECVAMFAEWFANRAPGTPA
jgi:hypothetical protein